MLVLQPVALVVLVAELAEELRERELDALGLLLVPGRGAEVVAAFGRGDGLHLLDADDAGQVVPAGLDLGEGGQHRDAARGTRGLVARRRQPAEGGVDLDEERAEVSLLAVELRREVAYVRDLHVPWLRRWCLEGALHALAHQRREMLPLLRPVAGEVGLIAAEKVDFLILCMGGPCVVSA